MKHIAVTDFEKIIAQKSNRADVDFINVCTPAEYKEKHITGVRSVPLDEIENHATEFIGKTEIYVHCRSGQRSQKAIEKLKGLNLNAELINVEGGLLAWEQAGFATGQLKKVTVPIMQQVLLTAGILVLMGTLGALLIHPGFLYLALFVGAGLTFAGATGWCGMAYMLSKMPWNK